MIIHLKFCKPGLLTPLLLTAFLLAAVLQFFGIELFGKVFSCITQWQGAFNQEIALKIKALQTGYSTALLAAMTVSAFLYGVIHAIGPGHGKSILAGWILTQRPRLRDIIWITSLSVFLHGFSSVVIISGIYLLMGAYIPGMIGKLYLWLNIVAGGILILAGIQLLYGGCCKTTVQTPLRQRFTAASRQLGPHFWVVLAIGIAPCPLAAAIFLMCLASGLSTHGLLFVAAFTLGMGLTLISVAITLWSVRQKARPAPAGLKAQGFLRLANISGALFFIILGIFIILFNSKIIF